MFLTNFKTKKLTKSNIYTKLQSNWEQNSKGYLNSYANKESDFVLHLLPEVAVHLPSSQVLETLAKRIGISQMQTALSPAGQIPSPIQQYTTTNWVKRVNMVGVNVRTIHSFWNVVKYALTLPASQSSIHLLPMWEPGVVSSLYGMASWNINPEFYSTELAHLVPQLNTVEKQLKAVVNLLHAMGKTVGMDVIPHTDRYSEMALAQPHFFEWLQRKEGRILDHRTNLHEVVQGAIMRWLVRNGSAQPAVSYPQEIVDFFGNSFPEEQRLQVLFGSHNAYQLRQDRRASLVDWLYNLGYEPVPATMGPPYRGLEVDPSPEARTIDFAGREWRDYRITQPQKMSRVFGPLARFKFYERKDDNQNWEIDFDRPRTAVWNYYCEHYASIQSAYNLDFMRGDMSHVQMRPEGVPLEIDEYYDPLGAVKKHIQQRVPYFAYFAESFLAPPGVMAYGDEVAHLSASHADTTLGDLQSMVVDSEVFLEQFAHYRAIHQSGKVIPNFTIMTGDKDDPRFDKFYLYGNEARLFMGLLLTDWPSYQGLGFEQRDPHPEPAPNEHYTKLYVFHLDEGPKATQGPYQWGKNGALFQRLHSIRQLADEVLPSIQNQATRWLLTPDQQTTPPVFAWTQADEPQYLFVVNLSGSYTTKNVTIPFDGKITASLLFSSLTLKEGSITPELKHQVEETNKGLVLSEIQAGECLCYMIN